MIGGYNRYGVGSQLSRSFENLPQHDRVRITGKYHLFDSWAVHEFKKF